MASSNSHVNFFNQLSTKNGAEHRLVLGPWSHASSANRDPFGESKQKCFQTEKEMARFLDIHSYNHFKVIQQSNNMTDENKIHYFTVSKMGWGSSNVWPPQNDRKTFYFSDEGVLSPAKTGESGSEEIAIDYNGNSMPVDSKWNFMGHTFQKQPHYYHDRTEIQQDSITFDSAEFENDFELTGDAEISVSFSADNADVALIAYLEDMDNNQMRGGKGQRKRLGSTYITEAVLRPSNTINPSTHERSFTKKDFKPLTANKVYEAKFNFASISYLIRRGHRLRVRIVASEERDLKIPGDGSQFAQNLKVYFGGKHSSSITLPGKEIVRPKPKPQPTKSAVPKSSDAKSTDSKDEL